MGRSWSVLKETGWHSSFWTALPGESKGALIVGAIGGSGAVVTLVVLGVVAILRKFD